MDPLSDLSSSSPSISNQKDWARRVFTHEIDEHAAQQSGINIQYEQLSAGVFQGEVCTVELEGLTLFHERTNLLLRQRGQLGDQVYGFAMSLEAEPEVYFHGQRLPRNGVMCGRGDELDMVCPANHRLIAIKVDQELLNTLWMRMYQKPIADWLERRVVLTLTDPNANALRKAHVQAIKEALTLAKKSVGAAALRQLRDNLLIEWIEALPPAVDPTVMQTSERQKALVDRACALILAQPEYPLSVLDLCTIVGASRRKLNYCFQNVLGTSPIQYLRALRLNGVRRCLLHGGPGMNVQDAAARWGFWHLSQLAQDYKQLFLELPSETLTRARLGTCRNTVGKP